MLRVAKKYNEFFNFNILPLVNKAPVGDWIKWQEKSMSAGELSSLNWNNINGIGAVCGINNLRCLDFDGVNDFKIVKLFLRKLGLPAEYKWTVASGSGKGYHIWFYCHDDSWISQTLGGQKSYYRLNPKPLPASPPAKFINPDAGSKDLDKGRSLESDKGRGVECDHIELRWKCCQTVLPPSLHSSGNKYKFLFLQEGHFPKMPPDNVPVGRLVAALTELCALNNAPPAKKNDPRAKEHNAVNNADINPASLARISEFLEGKIKNYDDWLRLGFALASLGEPGRQYFLTISRNNPDYNDTEESLNRKFDSLLKDYRGDIKIGSFYDIAKRYGYENSLKFFWKIHHNQAIIFSNLLIEFLESEGFGKMIINKDYMLIKDTANVISEETRVNIKDYVINFINDNTSGHNRQLIKEYLFRKINMFFGDSSLECLKTLRLSFLSDDKNMAYFYFRNCYIEVTKENLKQKQYSEIDGKIWAAQITEHDFHFTQAKSEFQTFIERICRSDVGRINALRSAIGYLLVSFKDPSYAKAVIFTDEKLSESAYGRSGKGLVAKAIGKMKNVLHIDGKNFSFDKPFMFQSVDPDTQLIIFDDVKKKFTFEKLFSILTDGITLEKKNRNEHYIPFEKSPKILITTNYAVEGTDDSSTDRQFVVEFSDYYNAKHKPKDEFGHLFFTDWNEEQWSAFFNYMADCCRFYLRNGLKPYDYVNLRKKKLIDCTSPEFEEFITSVPINTELNKKELFDQFKSEYEDFGQIKQNTLSRWAKMYAELYNLDVSERKSGQERFIRFTDIKK